MDNNLQTIQGVSFNLQHYSIHDGPGIRTNVFLNGCPLKCLWCQNPESQAGHPQLFLNNEKCIGCGKCAIVCSYKAISLADGKSKTDRNICQNCGKCTEGCPLEARTMMGAPVLVGEVFEEVKKDQIFYEGSGGGVTVSGGEPFVQAKFTAALLRLCKEACIHTAVETCGYAKWEVMQDILKYVDLVLYDFKHMDVAEHKKCTGVSNELILENVKKIYKLGIPVAARIPVIPGYNDSAANIAATAKFIAEKLGKDVKVHLLPFHKLGETKNNCLERAATGFSSEPPSDEAMEEKKRIVESFGLTAQIGG